MPACFYCHKQIPTTKMILVREYEDDHGSFYYFCSFFHLMAWLDEKFGTGRKEARKP